MRFRAAHSFGAARRAPRHADMTGHHPSAVGLDLSRSRPARGQRASRSRLRQARGARGRCDPGPRGQGTAYRNELISIVSVRPGPTPIAEIGAPDISSRAFTYACAFFGRSEKVLALVMSSDQPGRFS
ncbi:hypothetical protein SCALM49S_05983 [Streptomyces californicus]